MTRAGALIFLVLSACASPLQTFLSRDFCPYYHCSYPIRLFVTDKALPGDVNGYHSFDADGPYAVVTTFHNCPLTLCAAHEIGEMESDPFTNDKSREVFDGQRGTYLIDGEPFPNFRLPGDKTFCDTIYCKGHP